MYKEDLALNNLYLLGFHVWIVIYKAFCLDMAQGHMFGHPLRPELTLTRSGCIC